eukprot:symbB.v1.2.016485.t1/scaffold1242.1/size135964/5
MFMVAEEWWNLNSTRKRPAKVSPFYLAAWLAQLETEGNTIFLVLGALPAPSPPAGSDHHLLENFHDLAELRERASKSGGNPLASEADSGDEGALWMQAMVEDQVESKPRISTEQALSSMREMGFKTNQIEIALRLASGNGEVASHFLAAMEPVEPYKALEDATTWAKVIQASVLGLDLEMASMERLVQGMLRVATLLDSLTFDTLSIAAPGSFLDPQSNASMWEVTGGADKGGILVREGQGLSSKACDERLSTGATVKELQLVGDRLRYELITGTGPSTGWVSVKISGKELLKPQKAEALPEHVGRVMASPKPCTLGSSDRDVVHDGSRYAGRWRTWRAQQPCLLTDQRVWILFFLLCLGILWALESSVSWVLLCLGETLFFGQPRARHWRCFRLLLVVLAIGTCLVYLVLFARHMANGDLSADLIFSVIFVCIVLLQLRLKACDSCQGLIVSEKQHLHSDSETEDVNSVNATENTSTRRHPPQGCCCVRWRSRKISKICAAGGVCSAVLLSISLISHIIGCFVYAVSIPRPSWTEGTNGEPSVAYWCLGEANSSIVVLEPGFPWRATAGV